MTARGFDRNGASKKLRDAALDFITELRRNDPKYERPQVEVIEKQVSKCHSGESIKDAARELLRKRRESLRVPNESHIQAGPPPETVERRSTAATQSSSPPPPDSPLTKAFLGQYVSLLVQETVSYLKLSYKGLAQEMSMPETIIREAVQGKVGLTRGHWIKLGQLLKIATNFQLVKSERNGAPCWEVCYPPVPARIDKQ